LLFIEKALDTERKQRRELVVVAKTVHDMLRGPRHTSRPELKEA